MGLVLVANIGSTSFKFRLFDLPSERLLARGGAERIGGASSPWKFQAGAAPAVEGESVFGDYESALRWAESSLLGAGLVRSLGDLAAVGFKPVMAKGVSGTRVLDESVLGAMEALNTLFPAHNPPYVRGVRAFRRLAPTVPMIGTFETAFYDEVPEENTRFPVPLDWQKRHGIRRHGFHGASHRFVTDRVAELEGKPGLRVISCHLGGSSSVCAVRGGHAVDSSWGMTPQSGLPQNNRVGDFDVFAALYLIRDLGLGVDEVERQLSSNAGLKGMSGLPTGDLRDVKAAADAGNPDAVSALGVFVKSIRGYLGRFLVELGGADALVFTAGIGENNPWLRERVCAGLDFCGLRLDAAANAACLGAEARVSAPGSSIPVWVIPTNEEIVIARNAWRLLGSGAC